MENFQQKRRLWAVGLLVFFLILGQTSVFAEGRTLVPVGQTVGVTLDMEGVTIVDTADVESYDGKRYAPAKEAGLKAGDVVEEINGTVIKSAQQLEELVNDQGESTLEVKAKRQGEEKQFQVQAALSSADGHYRMGVWIKDAASGIGTVTYFDPQTREFGALGHGISENPDQEAIPIQGGSILKATVVSIQKGGKGQPGELVGVFTEGKEKLGSIASNTVVGLRGSLDAKAELDTIMEPVPVADRSEAQEGPAEILSNIEGNKVDTFSIEIQKINKDADNTKGMVVKVTDPRLLEKTGGIVQGMSGSPILQNGKLICAVTHVFLNDPTRGYGIFMDLMLR